MIRRHLSYANVVATFALVFAMSGGALAASHYLINSTKQINPKVLKSLKGANGKNGTNGTNGAPGATGATGPGGPAGGPGPTGSNGTDGTSVTSSKEAAGASCKNGGSKFVAGSSTTYACNGENGTTGYTETLPAGKAEHGNWSFNGLGQEEGQTNGHLESSQRVAMSFPIPLEKALNFQHVYFLNVKEKVSEHCEGTVETPTAEPGNLCVYTSALGGIEGVEGGEFVHFAEMLNPELGLGSPPGVGKSGGILLFVESGYGSVGYGDWVVRAPEA
jgi:hypothetical protein